MSNKERRILGFFVLAAGFFWLLGFAPAIFISEITLEGSCIIAHYIIVIWAITIIAVGLTMIFGKKSRLLGFINMIICFIALLVPVIFLGSNTADTEMNSFTEVLMGLLACVLLVISIIPILDMFDLWEKERNLCNSE